MGGRLWVESQEGEGSSQDNLSGGVISSLSVPVPGLREQDSIVKRLDAMQAIARSNAAEAEAAKRTVQALADELLSGTRLVLA